METMSGPDNSLIAEFNARRSEDAFAALVRQHVSLVFATAMRQVGDAGAAEEITQNVFVALAQAAGKLGSHPTIAGWLHQTALNKSREWLRSELRRRKREQVAFNLELAGAEGDSVWSSLVPLLDEALLKLRESDRQAVILHFMEGQTFQEVGSALGVGEDTARKRVHRCLDQLTDFFRRRGFAVPSLAAGAPLFALSSHAAPAGLAASATTAGLAAAHSAASTSTLTLIKGALKIMAWTKAKTAILGGVAVLLAVGITTVAIEKIETAKEREAEKLWRINKDVPSDQIDKLPPLVEVLPTKFVHSPWVNWNSDGNGDKFVGANARAGVIAAYAYGFPRGRIRFPDGEPTNRFDFVATFAHGSREALQRKLKTKLGLVGRRETNNMDVLLLRVKFQNTPGWKPPILERTDSYWTYGAFHSSDEPIDSGAPRFEGLADYLEDYFAMPVIDQTGITQHFSMDLRWKEEKGHLNHEGLEQALRNQLGLELVPTNMPIEMLVVERAKN